jgi:predicted PurR-regulated permease PerM
MLAIGVVCGVGDWLLGVPEALVLGIIAGLTEFIPNLGPVVGAVPAVLVAFGVGPWHALYVALFYAVVQGLEGNLLTPLVQQRAADVPPALTITAQLVMGLLGGILGVLLAVPLAASAIVAVRMAYVEDVLEDEAP